MADELFTPPQSGGTPQQITTPNAPGGPMTPGAKKAAEQRPTGEGPNGPPPEYDPTEVSPEEQANYEQLVLKAQESIMSNVGGVIDQMNRPDKPVYESVGKTGLMILQQVEQLAKAKGVEIDAEMMVTAGQDVVNMLMDVVDAAGIWPFKADSEEAEETAIMALYHGVELGGNQALGGAGGPQLQEDAGGLMAREVDKEREAGTLHPQFEETVKLNRTPPGARQ